MKKIYLLFVLLILIASCEKDEISKNDSTTYLKNNFNYDNFKDLVPYKFFVDWNAGDQIFLQGFDTSAVEFPIIFTSELTHENLNKKTNVFYKLMAKTNNGDFEFYINKYTNIDNQTIEKSQKFTGNIKTFNRSGIILASKWYENGKFISDLKNPDENQNSDQKTMPLNREYLIVRTWTITDWYRSDGSGGWVYTGTTVNGYSDEVVWNQSNYNLYNFWRESAEFDRSGGGGSGPYGSTYSGIAALEESTTRKIDERNGVYEIIKDSSFIGTKGDCVYEKLNSGSETFKEMIQKFDGEFPVAHLKFSVDYNLSASTHASTNNSGTNQIEIKINGNTIAKRTALGLSRTLAHEAIHAELYRKVRSVGGQISITDFPGIYDYYRRYVKWQHQQMAAHYRNTIVKIMKEYDNSANPDSFYNDLAWEGLHNTVAWNRLNPGERSRIKNQINNYKNIGNKKCN